MNALEMIAALKGADEETAAELVERLQCGEIDCSVLPTGKDSAVHQAQIWAQEARTQKGIVEEIGKLVGCANDWETVSAVKAALSGAQQGEVKGQYIVKESSDGDFWVYLKKEPGPILPIANCYGRGTASKVATALNAATAPQPAQALPERDPALFTEQQGLFHKFDVRRVDGSDQPGGKHHGCRYYVIDVDHDPHAAAALGAYANACQSTSPALARDLREKWGAAPQPAQVPESAEIALGFIKQALALPSRPLPDPHAHSHEAYARALHEAFCAIRFKLMHAKDALTAAPSGDAKREADKPINVDWPICNPACDPSLNGGTRSRGCVCEAAKASIARQSSDGDDSEGVE